MLPLSLLAPLHAMSSQYRSSWMNVRPTISRRFTTLEGWREVGTGVYAAGSSRVQVFSIQNQFDPDNYVDDRTSWTRPSKAESVSLHSWKGEERPPSSTYNDITLEKTKSVVPEPPYHIFSNKEKWTVVAMIGVAGLFSGLSSNIYFPALDAIAKVCQTCYLSGERAHQ